MAKKKKKKELVAKIDFDCLEADCGNTIQFNLMTLKENNGEISCDNCHRPYKFQRAFLNKLEKLRNLVIAVKGAEDIIDDCKIAVTMPGHEVKLPYRLLLTRLNTLISLKVGKQVVDFNFRIEPLSGSIK